MTGHFVQIHGGVVRVRHPLVRCTFLDTPDNWAAFVRQVEQRFGDGDPDAGRG